MRVFRFVYLLVTPFLFLSFLSGAGTNGFVVPADPKPLPESNDGKWADCTPEEAALFPKYMKVKTSHSGKRILLKISQARKSQPEACQSIETSEGWKQYRFVFSMKSPVQVKVHSAALGSLLWKMERRFRVTDLTLIAKQPGKPIYQMQLTDPATHVVYDFQINLQTQRVRVRTKS